MQASVEWRQVGLCVWTDQPTWLGSYVSDWRMGWRWFTIILLSLSSSSFLFPGILKSEITGFSGSLPNELDVNVVQKVGNRNIAQHNSKVFCWREHFQLVSRLVSKIPAINMVLQFQIQIVMSNLLLYNSLLSNWWDQFTFQKFE